MVPPHGLELLLKLGEKRKGFTRALLVRYMQLVTRLTKNKFNLFWVSLMGRRGFGSSHSDIWLIRIYGSKAFLQRAKGHVSKFELFIVKPFKPFAIHFFQSDFKTADPLKKTGLDRN